MTLGEFRNITINYSGKENLWFANSYDDVKNPHKVKRVIIDIGEAKENDQDPVTNIIVL